ncbi:hypothetical protein EHO60_02925 [Leptospira fletcheri]|uniref:Uncharacterized protein n=1 Tax=Leptospira fletcheri TaxID=2484981 RepID=A0A4R9GJ63_9LEPT|nr:hypothetical protein [Leptospira fletcheri]TGK13169.1 hypothetical protein EHO60_02925 [Leptospira fletcheri]
MRKRPIIFPFFFVPFLFCLSCAGPEKLFFQIDRFRPVLEKQSLSESRVEGEDCVGWFFPIYFGTFEPDLQTAYDNAIAKSPPGTESLANGEVFTKYFFLPPLIYIRCIVILGTPVRE